MIKLVTAIRKKYFDNTIDLSKLSKTFFVWAIGLVLVYVTNVYLTKLIGLSQYGKYTVFISWVSLISALLTFGWDGYLIQKIPQFPKNASGKIKSTTILLKAIGTLLVLYAVFAGVILLIAQYDKNAVGFLNAGQIPTFLLLVFVVSVLILLRAFLRIFNWVTVVQVIEELFKPLVLFIIILVFFKFNVALSLSALYNINLWVFTGVAVCLFAFAVQVYRKNFTTAQQDAVAENWMSKCFYFMCIFLGYSIFTRMELLFLGFFSRNEEAGQYQILLRISDLVILPDFLFNYFLPQKFSGYFANKQTDAAKQLFQSAAKTILLLQLLCFAGVLLIGYFYLMSFNIASTTMYMLLAILSSSQIFYSLFGTSNLVLKTSGNERYSFFALAIILVVELIADIIFIKHYGIIAAAVIAWLSIFAYTLLLSFFVHKQLSINTAFTRFLFFNNRNNK